MYNLKKKTNYFEGSFFSNILTIKEIMKPKTAPDPTPLPILQARSDGFLNTLNKIQIANTPQNTYFLFELHFFLYYLFRFSE